MPEVDRSDRGDDNWLVIDDGSNEIDEVSLHPGDLVEALDERRNPALACCQS